MASSHNYNAADLTSVLRTLSALSSTPAGHPQHPPQPAHPDNDAYDAYEPTDALPPSPIVPSQQQQKQPPPQPQPPQPEPSTNRPNQDSTPQPRSRTADNPPSALGDTSSISTWPAALRHVMRAVSQSEDLLRRIRWLIQRQHDHEKQWWQGREALVKKQRARVDKKKELDEVLRSVGAPIDNTKQISTAEEDTAELNRYDVKVYRASKQMADAMAAELRGLQIPFFSLKSGLVVDSKSNSNPPTGEILTRDELSGLRRRMLELLQDLCKE